MPETSARCLYATRPADRPDCQLTPVVTYATVPLCASCDRQRSTLGKGHRPRRLTPTQRLEPLDLITHTQTELHTAQQNLHAAVVRARQNGQPWSAIANRLGVTRQAAQQRFNQLDIYRSICVADGRTDWVHLRICLACEHIGCCDSSPSRHADEHFHDSGHPVMGSAESGESWRWCYKHARVG